VGSTCSASCQAGFTGNYTATCTATGSWSVAGGCQTVGERAPPMYGLICYNHLKQGVWCALGHLEWLQHITTAHSLFRSQAAAASRGAIRVALSAAVILLQPKLARPARNDACTQLTLIASNQLRVLLFATLAVVIVSGCRSPPELQVNSIGWQNCGTAVGNTCSAPCAGGIVGGYQATCMAGGSWMIIGICQAGTRAR
jgi:hypothetical protein